MVLGLLVLSAFLGTISSVIYANLPGSTFLGIIGTYALVGSGSIIALVVSLLLFETFNDLRRIARDTFVPHIWKLVWSAQAR